MRTMHVCALSLHCGSSANTKHRACKGMSLSVSVHVCVCLSHVSQSHVETLKKRFAQWYATHGPTSAVDSGPPQNPLSSLADKAKTASDYAQIVIYAAVAKLLGQDDDNRISDNMVKYTGELIICVSECVTHSGHTLTTWSRDEW